MTGAELRELVSELRRRGVTLEARGDRLAYRGPAAVLTPRVKDELLRHKPRLLAILSGRPVPSRTPGVVWDPRGGVRVEHPPDLRLWCLEQARLKGWPGVSLKDLARRDVPAGAEAWARFAREAPFGEGPRPCWR